MHIVIGVITALAGLIWALHSLQRSGFDLNSLNPFAWYRRRQWRLKYDEKPAFKLSDPMEVAALVLLGIAKCEGEISSEQKQSLLAMFRDEFQISDDEAADLLLASSHILRDEIYLSDNLNKLFQSSAERFNAAQVAGLLSMMRRVADLEGDANQEQLKFIRLTEEFFAKRSQPAKQWS